MMKSERKKIKTRMKNMYGQFDHSEGKKHKRKMLQVSETMGK